MTKELKVISQLVDFLINQNAKSVVKYMDDKLIVRASRKLFRGKIERGNIEIYLTIGKPNYKEREFIKDCKKAGEPFPVKKIQFKLPPKRRKK